MFHPTVIAAKEAALHDALGDASGTTLIRRPHDLCWALRDQLLDSIDAKGKPTRALTPEEAAFIRDETLLGQIDFRHWAERWAQIAKETQETAPFLPLWASQELFLARVAEIELRRWESGSPDGILVNCLKARQLGQSTITEVIMAHGVTTQLGLRALVAADVQEQSQYMFSMAETVIKHLPPWLRPSVKAHQAQVFWEAETGSSLRAAWGKSARGGLQDRDKAKGNLGRGRTFRRLHLSELSSWERPEQINDALLPGVPIRPGVFGVFESTAKGRHDWWHTHWLHTAKGLRISGRAFDNVFIPWYIEPDKYWLPAPEGWAPALLTLAHAEAVLRDSPLWCLGRTVRLSREQLYWWESTRAAFDEAGDLYKFLEEYTSCVTAETRVSTERGILPISEGITCKETESGPIVAAGPQPVSAIYKLETLGGRVLRGTYDHPVQRPDGSFTGLGRLAKGDEVVLRAPRFAAEEHTERWYTVPRVEHQLRIDILWARFLGYFMGDGSWYKGNLCIVCDAHDEDVIEDVRQVLTALFGPPRRSVVQRVKGRKDAVLWQLGIKEVAQDVFKRLGLIRSGRTGEERYRRWIHVPEVIWRSPCHVVREFLRALFECDGSASGTFVSWGSSKLEFAREIQLLLLGFGLPFPITANNKRGGSGHAFTFSRIQLSREGTTRFREEIGFIGRRKQAKCHFRSGRQLRGVRKLGRPAGPLKFSDTVASVTADGYEVTYDLTVGTTHVFSANGILTHNTPEESFQFSGRSIFSAKTLERVRLQERPPQLFRVRPAKDIAQLKVWAQTSAE